MSLPLSSSTETGMRKDLVRLRMEMHRQQLLYNAQPLANPLRHAKGMMTKQAASAHQPTNKHPLIIAASVALALFGRRLGKVGRLARFGLVLYPLIKGQQKLRQRLR